MDKIIEEFQSNLISVKDLEKILTSMGKKRHWLHTLRSRHGLLPEPMVKPRLVLSEDKDKPWEIITHGRIILYPKDIIRYLEKIIFLKTKRGLNYKQIKGRDDIKNDLNKLKLLKETEVEIDARLRSEGFFLNFESARENLKRVLKWENESHHVKFLQKIAEERNQYGREYYKINKQMRQQVINESKIDQRLRQKKRELGNKIDYYHTIIDAVIKYGVKLMKEGVITAQEWLKPIKKMRMKER